MSFSRFALSSVLSMMLFASTVQAHFIWVVTEPAEQSNKAKIYLSEEAAPDDPELLKNIATAKAWAVGSGKNEPLALTLKVEDDALVGEIPEKFSGRPVVVSQSYGVMSRGPKPFLLQYYAKSYPSQLPSAWQPVAKPELLPLEVNPELKGTRLTLKVTFQGKPAANCQVTVEGPGIKEKIQGNADEKGQFVAEVAKPGIYSIRARVEEEAAGQFDGKKYEQIKHYSTVSLRVTPATVTTADDKWPALAKGITSFGAGVVGDELYIYGGHLGGAHEYLPADQSNTFQKLNLKGGGEWVELPSGPKRTGLAMVVHNGKLYRIGGFEVIGEGEDNLTSRPDFARFDPATNAWEDLTPLPEGRSSHDAVVIGDTIYVVGGWQMKAGEADDHPWLKTAWSCDLSQPNLVWKELTPPPFERRAVSLATQNGLLYVIGGMQSKGGPTTQVAVYNPADGTWSAGPSLIGTGMDGFGTASFVLNGRIVTTTMSGSILQLSEDGSHWDYLGQMAHPRFFHEMIPWQNQLVIVGGASMQTGKVNELEVFSIGQPEVADQKAALAQ